MDAIVSGSVKFIKIDVEGLGLEVLKGASKIISDSKPIVLVELDEGDVDQLQEWCRCNKYEITNQIGSPVIYLLEPNSS